MATALNTRRPLLHSARDGYYTQHETTIALSDTEQEYISTTIPSRGISSRDNDTTSKDDDTTSNDDDTTSSDDDTTSNSIDEYSYTASTNAHTLGIDEYQQSASTNIHTQQ